MLAIFKREIRAYFSSPLGYIFLAVIYCFGGQFFSTMLVNSSSNIAYVFARLLEVVMIIIPILTMRLMSEDKKLKTDQLLLTSPVNVGSIILGKYFAALTMFVIGILSTIVYVVILSTFTVPNWSIFFGNLLAILLLGAALIAIGLFISSLTENQMISAILSFAIMMVLWMFDTFAAQVTVPFLGKMLSSLSFTSRYQDLISGIFDVSHILFFLSVAVIFNFLSARMLERKRWS